MGDRTRGFGQGEGGATIGGKIVRISFKTFCSRGAAQSEGIIHPSDE